MKYPLALIRLLSGAVAISALALSSATFARSAVDVEQPTQVVLLNHGLQLSYPQPVRLEQVLLDAEQQNRLLQKQALSFHQGFQLFNLNKQAEVEALLHQVRQQLTQLAEDATYRDVSQRWLAKLNQTQFGYRETVNLDLDAVRLKAELNPALPGHYALKQIARPNTVLVTGLIEEKALPFAAHLNVADYIAASALLDAGDRSEAWVIAPNGESDKVGYGNWNNQHSTVVPGSTIFIGFNSDDDELQALERNLVKLLGMIKG